jgi:hypothetical protein
MILRARVRSCGFPLAIGSWVASGLLLASGCGPADAPPSTETQASSDGSPVEATSPPATTSGSVTPPPASSGGREAQSPTAGAVGDTPSATTSALTGEADKRTASGAIEIIFEDIQLLMQADTVFRPIMLTERAKSLDGQRIRVSGYMLPDSKSKNIKQFVLLKNTECKFGPGGQADHLINVLMTKDATASYRDDAVAVEGTLRIKPFQGPDGNTWSIYDLECDLCEKYQPRR